jgi:hypothetical protein
MRSRLGREGWTRTNLHRQLGWIGGVSAAWKRYWPDANRVVVSNLPSGNGTVESWSARQMGQGGMG